MDDDELLVRSIADPSAFEQLVVQHGAALYAYLARRAGSEADDLLSDVWLAAFRSRSSFDARRGGARAWLFGVARHVLLGRLKSSRAVAQPAGAEDVDDGWDRVDERLTADAVRPALREALTSLAPADREVLLLVAWEQLTPGEAAVALGIPAGTARSRLHRAREQLRGRLGPLDSMTGVITDGGKLDDRTR